MPFEITCSKFKHIRLSYRLKPVRIQIETQHSALKLPSRNVHLFLLKAQLLLGVSLPCIRRRASTLQLKYTPVFQ